MGPALNVRDAGALLAARWHILGTMTTPNQDVLIDAGNNLLDQVTANLSTGTLNGPQGSKLVLTVRTASTTLTVIMDKADGLTWAQNIKNECDKMSGSGLLVAKG